jgi:hypothetical protein
VWLILGFHICFYIGNDMSRVHGYVDPLHGGGLLGLLCTDGKWRVVQLVRARRVGALGHGSLMRLVRERERERERERDNNGVVLTGGEGWQHTLSGVVYRRRGGEVG